MHVNCIRTRVISLLAAINLINFFHIRSILELLAFLSFRIVLKDMVRKYTLSLSVHIFLSFLVFCLEGKIKGGGVNNVQRFLGKTIRLVSV
jgi:hypothetical protein